MRQDSANRSLVEGRSGDLPGTEVASLRDGYDSKVAGVRSPSLREAGRTKKWERQYREGLCTTARAARRRLAAFTGYGCVAGMGFVGILGFGYSIGWCCGRWVCFLEVSMNLAHLSPEAEDGPFTKLITNNKCN